MHGWMSGVKHNTKTIKKRYKKICLPDSGSYIIYPPEPKALMIFVFPFGGDMDMFPGGYDSASCRIYMGLTSQRIVGSLWRPRENNRLRVRTMLRPWTIFVSISSEDGMERNASRFLTDLECNLLLFFGSDIFHKKKNWHTVYRSQEMLLKKGPLSQTAPQQKDTVIVWFCLRIDEEFLAFFGGFEFGMGSEKMCEPCWLQFWNRLASWVLTKPGLNDLYVLDTRDNVCLSFTVEWIECKFMHWHSAKKLLGPPKSRLFPWFSSLKWMWGPYKNSETSMFLKLCLDWLGNVYGVEAIN